MNGFLNSSLKGKNKVKGEFGPISLTYNLKRVISIKNGKNGNNNHGNTGNKTLFEEFHVTHRINDDQFTESTI